MSLARVVVSKRGAERARAGHLWVYRSEVREVSSATGGAVVSVTDPYGNFVGRALFSDKSEITLRLLTQEDEPIDRDWWRNRIRNAAARRQKISSLTNAHRMVFGESDLLPSLIIDRYQDVLVLQTLSQGTESVKKTLVELLVEEFSPAAIIERNDVRVREHEGLARTSGVLYGNSPDELEITQHGVRFLVAPLAGQKTGLFLDQRENHLAAAAVAYGRALDCFTFTGGFALHMATRCENVVALDISAQAIAGAERNARLNGVANVHFREANVFDALREFESEGEQFDLVALDPPAFAKNRSSIKSGARGYKEINLRALKLLRQGGLLVSCTCSYHISEKSFLEILAAAANDAHRRIQILEKRMQASDHPMLLSMPETYYLKCIIARVIY